MCPRNVAAFRDFFFDPCRPRKTVRTTTQTPLFSSIFASDPKILLSPIGTLEKKNCGWPRFARVALEYNAYIEPTEDRVHYLWPFAIVFFASVEIGQFDQRR